MARRGGCSGGQTPAAQEAPGGRGSTAEAFVSLAHQASQTGREIKRVVVAYEAGRDGFWLARWLRTRGVEAYVIHPASIAVSREHRRAKTDRLDTELLMRAFLGWLRGEKRHCSMAAVPAAEEEDARRPNREREDLVTERTRIANQMKAILARFGIRSFKPTLRKAAEKLDGLRTAEGTPSLENTRAELSGIWHGCALCASRSVRLSRNVLTNSRQPQLRRKARMPWFGSLRGCSVLVSRRPTCWSTRSSRVTCAIARLSPATPGLPARRTRAVNAGASVV